MRGAAVPVPRSADDRADQEIGIRQIRQHHDEGQPGPPFRRPETRQPPGRNPRDRVRNRCRQFLPPLPLGSPTAAARVFRAPRDLQSRRAPADPQGTETGRIRGSYSVQRGIPAGPLPGRTFRDATGRTRSVHTALQSESHHEDT